MNHIRKYRSLGLITLSIIFISIAITQYVQHEYTQHVSIFILLAITSGALCFFKRADVSFIAMKYHFFWISLLLCIVAPVYLYHFYTIPWQINTDEIAIMNTSKTFISQPGLDILGASYYLGFAAYIFYVFGKLSTFLGGIDLYHYRLVHVLSGILISVIAYAFFYQLTNKRWQAFGFAIGLSANHALFAISRMAMRDNTGLLIELLALTLLIYGWKHKRNFWLFLGGVVAALSFYTYFPSRVTMAIWIIFVLSSVLFIRFPYNWKEAFNRLMVSLFGFFLLVPFMLISTARHPDLALHYSRQQFLFYPEGRDLQQGWVLASSPWEGWLTNIKNGLGTFNNHVHDLGYIYANYGHGFVDPLTGTLLWIGVILVLWRWYKTKQTTLADLLCLIGFSSLYIAFSFLITKAPNYTRLFVTLPFVIYFAGQGAIFITSLLIKLMSLQISFFKMLPNHYPSGSIKQIPTWGEKIILTAILMIIVGSNGLIFYDFVLVGMKKGNDVGDTARYVLERNNLSHHQWIIAADKSNMYYSWGNEYSWKDWLGFFASSNQVTQVIAPEELLSLKIEKPFTVFLANKTWEWLRPNFIHAYPNYHVNKITPDGNLLAVEVAKL